VLRVSAATGAGLEALTAALLRLAAAAAPAAAEEAGRRGRPKT
jgi:hypothetical protein